MVTAWKLKLDRVSKVTKVVELAQMLPCLGPLQMNTTRNGKIADNFLLDRPNKIARDS